MMQNLIIGREKIYKLENIKEYFDNRKNRVQKNL